MHSGAEPASSPQGIQEPRRDSSGPCRAVDDGKHPTATTTQSTSSASDQPSGSKSDNPRPAQESPTMAQSAVLSASNVTTNEPTSLAQKLAEVLAQSDKSILKELESLIDPPVPESSWQGSASTGTKATPDTPSMTTAAFPATPMFRNGAEAEREHSPGTRSLHTTSDAQPSHLHTAARDLEARDQSRDQEDGPSDGKSALVPEHSESLGGPDDPDGNTEAGSADEAGDFPGGPRVDRSDGEWDGAGTDSEGDDQDVNGASGNAPSSRGPSSSHPGRAGETRQCSECLQFKPLAELVQTISGNYSRRCRACWQALRRNKYRKAHEEISKRNEELASTNRKVCTKCRRTRPIDMFQSLLGNYKVKTCRTCRLRRRKASPRRLEEQQGREPTGARSTVSTGSEGSNHTDGKASDGPAQGGKRRGARLNGEEAPTLPRMEGPGSNAPSEIAEAEDDSDHAPAPAATTSRSKKRRLSAHPETDSRGEHSKRHRRDKEPSSVLGAADEEASLPNSDFEEVNLRGGGAGEPPPRGVAPPLGIHANPASGGGATAATTFRPTTASTTGRGATSDSQLPGSSSSPPSGKPASDSATTTLRLPTRVPRFFGEVSGSELTLATKYLDGASAEELSNFYGGGAPVPLSDDHLRARARLVLVLWCEHGSPALARSLRDPVWCARFRAGLYTPEMKDKGDDVVDGRARAENPPLDTRLRDPGRRSRLAEAFLNAMHDASHAAVEGVGGAGGTVLSSADKVDAGADEMDTEMGN
ncbi:hypothetical protein DL769_004568 [Monosporascus sp. CRB-8-3]|nr:hypothetical protein DL769_004568 [Monosporascus sp. CRB-8-3]